MNSGSTELTVMGRKEKNFSRPMGLWVENEMLHK